MLGIRLIKKFFTKFEEVESGCWEWNGTRHGPNGYGRLHVPKGSSNLEKDYYLAHRISYRIYNGEFDDGLCVCHKCDNTICVNPDHLFLGTVQDNVTDMINKGRGNYTPKNQPRLSHNKLQPEDVIDIYRTEIRSHKGYSELAEKYGVSSTAIRDILENKSWKWLTSQIDRITTDRK